jgi:PTH2 family peptidyl-tRNA hydrolase
MTKMALIVRRDLPMSRGKLAAQTAHAAVLATTKASGVRIADWFNTGMTKVVLEVPDLDAMMEIARQAQAASLTTALITDEGRTEVAPGSITALAVGPGDIDSVTGALPLLRD